MTKIVLQDTNSGHNLQTINDNFRKIEDEFNKKVLYRDNPVGEPNEVQNDLDMNGKRIYNLPAPIADHEPARFKEVQEVLPAAQSAKNSEINAKNSEINAKNSELSALGAKEYIDDVVDNATAALGGLGYQVPVPYVSGLEMVLANQTVTYNGQTYAPILDEVPFTTSGTFETDKFRLIQGVSGTDLAAPYGAAMVGYKGVSVDRALDERVQSVATIADLRALTDVMVGQVFCVNGIGTFEAVPGAFADDGILFVTTANGVRCKILSGIVASNASVYVPSYYPTMQAAIDDLYPRVKTVSGAKINVQIEAGHEITAGLNLQSGDYSDFRISSADATVYLAADFSFVGPSSSIFTFNKCHAPDINILVDAAGRGGRAFSYVESRGRVGQGGGAINAGTDALYMNSGSIVIAHKTVWDGAGNLGAWVTRVSLLDAEESSFSNCNKGVTVRRGSRANITNSVLNNNTTAGLTVTRSYVNLQGREDAVGSMLAECNGNGGNGVEVVRGSVATLTGLQANNNGGSGVRTSSGSVIDFDFGEAIGNANIGLFVQGASASALEAAITGNGRNILAIGSGATVDLAGADVSGAVTINVQCSGGASVNLTNATGNNAGTIGIEVRDGGVVAAPDAVFNDAGEQGALCNSGTLNAPRAQFRRARTWGVRAVGSTVYLTGANCQKTDGVNEPADIDFSSGSTVHANGTLGGYPPSVTPNTISGTRGILYGA